MTSVIEGFSRVASLADVVPGTPHAIEAKGQEIGLYNLDGQIYAIGDVCTHAYANLSEGDLIENVIMCPLHGAEFDICTGQALCLPAIRPVPTYEVRVEGNDIWLKI